MKIPKQKIELWIEVLRSGLYEQGKGKLQNGNKFCCLGVACDIFIPHNKLSKIGSDMFGTIPGSQPACPEWLSNINTIYVGKASIDNSSFAMSLIGMNDAGNASFDEIADMLQLMFIEGALD